MSSTSTGLLWRLIMWLLRVTAILVAAVLVSGLTLSYIFKMHPWAVRYLVFMNHIHFPPYRNFSDLDAYGLRGENLYLPSGPNQLGVWKLEPDVTTDGKLPVVMYIHGAQGSRAAYHRVQMYQVLLGMGCPVVTFDYRGYGDSTGVPMSESDLLEDSLVAYRWARKQFPGRELIIWAHSLGTGVSVRLIQSVESAGPSFGVISGLILDSPYSSMFDVLHLSPLLNIFHRVPAFTAIVMDAMREADVTLNSSDRIRTTRVPLLILHAEDDWVIPVSLGRKLFNVAERRGEVLPGVVSEYVEYSSALKYGHRGIYRDPVLPERVLKFSQQASEWRKKKPLSR